MEECSPETSLHLCTWLHESGAASQDFTLMEIWCIRQVCTHFLTNGVESDGCLHVQSVTFERITSKSSAVTFTRANNWRANNSFILAITEGRGHAHTAHGSQGQAELLISPRSSLHLWLLTLSSSSR